MNVFMHPLLGATPWALLRTATSNKTRPTVHFLPKFVFVLAVNVLNLPFIILEELYLALFKRRGNQTAPIFIIGHPRTGTTHLQQVLSDDPQFFTPQLYQILFPNYSNTFARLLNLLIFPFFPKTRPQDNVELGLEKPQEEEFALAATSGLSFINAFYFPKKFRSIINQAVLFENPRDKRRWQRSLSRFVRSINRSGKTLILKSPANMARIDAILELFPGAKFIHIQRDSSKTFQSTLHLFEQVLPQTSFQMLREEEMVDNAFFMFETFYTAYRRQSARLDANQLLEVSHEGFTKNPDEELAKIYSFMGKNRPPIGSRLTDYKNYQKNNHKPLPNYLVKRLRDVEEKIAAETYGKSTHTPVAEKVA